MPITPPADLNQYARDSAVATIATDRAPQGKFLRAAASVLVDEINIVRLWTRDLKTGVAAATTLADVKAAIAALPTLSDRTLAQAKTAMQTKIAAGDVD